MNSPPPNPGLDELREWLRAAVPRRAADLLRDHSAQQLATLLPELARGAGVRLDRNGDAMLFPPRKHTPTADLATGVAAAALIAGPNGIRILGLDFSPDPDNGTNTTGTQR